MNNMNTLNLQAIAAAGGSVIVDANNYNTLNLQAIASAGKAKGATLIINNANTLNVLNCQAIAGANPGHVIFNFC